MKENNQFIVGMVGGGTLARGLTKLFIKSGISALVVLRDIEKLKNLEEEITKYRKDRFPKGVKSYIRFSTDLRDLASCGLILEAIVEDLDQKVYLHKKLKKLSKKNTIVATTTSSLGINKLAKAGRLERQLIGLHFFNPPQAISFLEIIPSDKFNGKLLGKLLHFIKLLRFEYVILPDTPGFVANKILFSMLLSAVKLHLKDKIKKEDIDKVITKSLKHPLGPFELLDLIGIDTADKIFHNLYTQKTDLGFWKKYYEKTKIRKNDK